MGNHGGRHQRNSGCHLGFQVGDGMAEVPVGSVGAQGKGEDVGTLQSVSANAADTCFVA